jgi:PAS domain S-box-containing protein
MSPGLDECWKSLVHSTTDYAFLLLSDENRILAWNQGAQLLFGYTEGEVIGQSGSLLFTPEDRDAGAPQQEFLRALSEGRAEDERWHIRKDGSRFRASGVLSAVRDSEGQLLCLGKIQRNVTDRERSRERLEQSLRERTVLLSEIHHRVKNNLQMIVSLMSLQADRLHNPEALKTFEEMQNRVRAIAHIHERLYSTQDFAAIHFGDYLHNLVEELKALYEVSDRIALHVSSADIALDIEKAIPLGLISSELVCNAFKYAFPDHAQGEINVVLRYQEGPAPGTRAQLQVWDNGIGLPENVDFEGANSMGFYLIRLLAKQLRGSVTLEKGPGFSILISFPLDVAA